MQNKKCKKIAETSKPPERQLEAKPNPSGVSHYGKKDLARSALDSLKASLK